MSIPIAHHSKGFWLMTVARGLSMFASQMLAIVIGWSIFHRTHSTLALGLAGLCEFLPAIGLALWAGWLVDRHDALKIFRRTIAAQALVAGLPLMCLALVPAASTPLLLASLYSASLVSGAVRAFQQPCMYSITPRLVPTESLPWAASWSSAVLQSARVLGPGLGGILYGAVGFKGSLALPLVLLVVALLASLPVALRTTSDAVVAVPPSAPGAVYEGLKFVLRHKILLPALSLDMICVLFGGVTAVLPAFAENVLHAGPSALGWLRAAPAMGAVVGSVILTRIDVRPVAGRALLWSVAGFGLCTLGFALSRSLVVSFGLLLASGLLDSVSVQVRQLIVQLMSPPNMRGRISAVNSMFLGSSNELGEFESGVMAWWLGLVPSVLWGCTLCLGYVAISALRATSLRQLDLRRIPSPQALATGDGIA